MSRRSCPVRARSQRPLPPHRCPRPRARARRRPGGARCVGRAAGARPRRRALERERVLDVPRRALAPGRDRGPRRRRRCLPMRRLCAARRDAARRSDAARVVAPADAGPAARRRSLSVATPAGADAVFAPRPTCRQLSGSTAVCSSARPAGRRGRGRAAAGSSGDLRGLDRQSTHAPCRDAGAGDDQRNVAVVGSAPPCSAILPCRRCRRRRTARCRRGPARGRRRPRREVAGRVRAGVDLRETRRGDGLGCAVDVVAGAGLRRAGTASRSRSRPASGRSARSASRRRRSRTRPGRRRRGALPSRPR